MFDLDPKYEEANLRFDYLVEQQEEEHQKNRIKLADKHKIGRGVISSSYHNETLELELEFLRRLLDQRLALISEVFFNYKPRTDQDADFLLRDLERIYDIRTAVSRKSLASWLKVSEQARVLIEFNKRIPSLYASLKSKIRIIILSNRRKYPEIADRSISELLADEEGRQLEFKATFQWDIKKQKKNLDLKLEVAQAIAAFSNTDGGYLIIGVADDRTILGLEDDYAHVPKRRDGLQILISQELEQRIDKGFAGNLKTDFSEVEGKDIYIIKVMPADGPVWVKEDSEYLFYVREQNRTIRMKSRDASNYILKRFGGPTAS